MKVALRADGLVVEDSLILATLDATLRGVGQVMLQNNTWSGVFFVAGTFAASPVAGLALVVGAVVGTLTSMALGAPRDDIKSGLFGFNGALVGVALAVFLRADPYLWAMTALGAAGSSVVAAAMARALQPLRLPALTAPFVLVTWAILVTRSELAQIVASPAMAAPHLASAAARTAVSETTLADGALRGIAQIFVQADRLTGGLFLAGLLVASWRAALVAALGSLGGVAVGAALGAAEPALRAGLYSYNSALVAIALLTFLPSTWSTAAYASLAVVAGAIASASCAAMLGPVGLPALTAAFIAVTWAALLAAPSLARVAPRDPA